MFAAPLSQPSINCNCLEYRCVCMQCVRVLCRATSKRGRQTDAVIPTRICLNDEIIAFNFDVRLTNVLSLVLSQHKYTHRYCVVLLLCPQEKRVIVSHLGNFSLFVFLLLDFALKTTYSNYSRFSSLFHFNAAAAVATVSTFSSFFEIEMNGCGPIDRQPNGGRTDSRIMKPV